MDERVDLWLRLAARGAVLRFRNRKTPFTVYGEDSPLGRELFDLSLRAMQDISDLSFGTGGVSGEGESDEGWRKKTMS